MIIGKSDAADTQMHSKHYINNEWEIKIQSVLHSSSDPLVSFRCKSLPPRLLSPLCAPGGRAVNDTGAYSLINGPLGPSGLALWVGLRQERSISVRKHQDSKRPEQHSCRGAVAVSHWKSSITCTSVVLRSLQGDRSSRGGMRRGRRRGKMAMEGPRHQPALPSSHCWWAWRLWWSHTTSSNRCWQIPDPEVRAASIWTAPTRPIVGTLFVLNRREPLFILWHWMH